MKLTREQSLLALTVFTVLCFTTSVQAQVIRWAGRVDVGGDRVSILHAPDDRFISLAPPITVSDFGFNPSAPAPGMRYSGLARLLGLPDSVLAKADVIAFEGNGGHPGGAGISNGWESSIWTFSDGINSHSVRFTELVSPSQYPTLYPALIANGSIRGADGTFSSGGNAYNAFFGMCPPNPGVISYILFDLDAIRPAINTASPNFSIRVENGFTADKKFGEGTPDPDSIGIFSSCPSK